LVARGTLVLRGNETKGVAVSKSVEAAARPFVILVRDGRAERPCFNLVEAVAFAKSGDTIEIRGDGPFVSRPVTIRGTALTIRGGEGFRPVLRLDAEGVRWNSPVLYADVPLVLENLEFQQLFPNQWKVGMPVHSLNRSIGSPIRVANCRFVSKAALLFISAEGSPLCETRNCEFLNQDMSSVKWVCPPGGRFIMDNCLHGNVHGVEYYWAWRDLKD